MNVYVFLSNREQIVIFFLALLLLSCSKNIVEPLKEITQLQYTNAWHELNAYPAKRGRTDDLHFFDPLQGFVINSNGYLVYTEDGGESWEIKHENKGTFFRCLTFKNRKEGWLGTIGTEDAFLPSKDTIALYQTSDGGDNWQPVRFKGPHPKGLCGLQKVNDQFIVGCGRVRGPSYFIKTVDGGKTWNSYDMNHLAGSLIAPFFFDDSHGILIGGTTRDKKNCQSLILETFDGGSTWDTLYMSTQKGEYCWKVSFPSRDTGYISIQRNVRNGRFYHLQTIDGGRSWQEKVHAPDYYYVQGVGFINTKTGWLGGSNNWTYETRDGGRSWLKVGDIGRGFNNFQFFGDTLAYGVGFGVFRTTTIYPALNQTRQNYYDDGKLKSFIRFVNGYKNGEAETFYPDGKLESKGQFENNLKIGRWIYYHENGNVAKKIVMKNGLAKVSKKTLQSYAGKYETADGSIREIIFENESMFSKRDNGNKLEIFPETDTRFFYKFNPKVTIEFLVDPQGKVTHSQSFQNGKYSRAIRIN